MSKRDNDYLSSDVGFNSSVNSGSKLNLPMEHTRKFDATHQAFTDRYHKKAQTLNLKQYPQDLQELFPISERNVEMNLAQSQASLVNF